VAEVSASKFTPEIRGGLLERTAAGVSLSDAARAVGVRETTAKSWLTRGRREESGEYADFAAAMDEAREAAKSRPDAMDEAELGRLVSGMARKGSVQAAKLSWEMLRAPSGDEDTATDDPLAEVDELARRRRARA
jgi:hypothetical protein